ncbi:hypothetical protein L1987_66509 [Smallanthus sonchifolius]|uniref:Uncharacterized protein n=1 Tax=Smallanthus sonchifolius TaxID=185202 RepID=A0ACB9BXN9_9ASTR|nr:hypothetical protein L1987_66509 [Smallanthus sonchifolius]
MARLRRCPRIFRLVGVWGGGGFNRTGYRDVVGSSSGHGRKVITAPNRVLNYPNQCSGRAVIGEAKSVTSFNSIRKTLDNGGDSDVSVSYIGGLKVLVVFKDMGLAQRFIADSTIWSNHLSSVTLWTDQVVSFDRIACLKIVGIPLHLREDLVFEMVGNLFGKIIWPSAFSWTKKDCSFGVCYVLTSIGARIEESIELVWKNTSLPVWVTEELCSWVPCFDDDSSESSGSPGSVSVTVNEVEELEMEEGEFVRPDTGNLVDKMEVEQAPVVHTPEVEKIGSGPGDNEELHGEGGPNDLIGDSNLELNALDNGDIGVAKDVGPTSSHLFLAANNAKLVGSGDGPCYMLGLNQTPLPRKRPRCLRSPQSSESQHGPTGLKPVIISGEVPDLNAPLRNMKPESPSFLRPMEASDEVIPDSYPSPNPGIGLDPGDINNDVELTVQVGELIGVDLVGSEGIVADEIEGERRIIGFQ